MPGSVHETKSRTLSLEGLLPKKELYAFTSGNRTGDGGATLHYDESDRLVEITTAQRQILYAYDPLDRLIGRTVNVRDSADVPWALEDRTTALARDGLPPAVTFVWDPIADRLLEIFEAGKGPKTPTDPPNLYAGLMRQYIHGDQGYDDPIEVLAATEPGAPPKRYLPFIDPTSGGSVTAILDASGNLVERVLYADSYGDAPRYVEGPVIDGIKAEAAKDSAGKLESIRFRIHSSEAIDADSIDGNVALVVRTGKNVDGTPIESDYPLAAKAEGANVVLVELDATQWADLASEATEIRLEVRSGLRSPAWGTTPVQPAPAWATKLYGVQSSTATPVAWSESLATLSMLIENTSSGQTNQKTLYTIPDLYLAASTDSKTKLLTGLKAAPFVEPATGLAYFRNRWYDPSTGTFLTPDPMGYHDSSNLYAFAKNDPVNGNDPTGLCEGVCAGAIGGFIWGAGQVIVAGVRDASHGDVYGYDRYFSIWGQNIIGGVELGVLLTGV